MRITVHEPTRLRAGMVVDYDGRPHFVERVTPSCAVVRGLGKIDKRIRTRNGKDVLVHFNPPSFRISANSDVRIIGRARNRREALRLVRRAS